MNCFQRVKMRLSKSRLRLLALAVAVGMAGVPRAWAEPATQPAATQPVADIRLNFRDTPLDVVLEHLSQVAGFNVVKEAPVDGRVTVMSMQALTPGQAVNILNTVLKANGLTAIQDGNTLRIVARDKAKKSNIPVHFGDDPTQIDAGDELITQVIPIKNVDAVKLRDDLRSLIGPDADVAANGGSNAIVLTDASSNIKRIAQIISLLDKKEATASVIRVVQLKNANAAAAARLVVAIFPPQEPRGPRGQQQQQQPPPPPQETTALGNGVDQALHGGKVTAAADDRTNTVVIAGPAETVKIIEDMLQKLDANPAQVVTIRSFHLKTASADEVSSLITSVFSGEGTGTQIRGVGGGDQPLRARVSAVAEYRTNTVVVTAPQEAMTAIEMLIKEQESNPNGEQQIKSFHLKYADATAAATALESALGGFRRRGPGALERVVVTPDPRTNTVIISGPADSIHEAETLLVKLDTNPTEGSVIRYFHLKMADAGAAAKMIDGFFQPTEGKKSSGTEHAGVNAQADERSNTVVVSAPPDAMTTVEQIIKEIEAQPWVSYDVRSYTLTFADAESTAKLISSIFAPDQNPNNPYTKNQPLRAAVIAAPDDRTNSVVITAPLESLKVIDAIIKLLDSNPGTNSQMKVFPLQYADAESAAKLIQTMFPQPNAGMHPPPGPSGILLTHMPVVITSADDRTNTLVVTAPADVLKVVETLVHQLDSNPASKETFFIYRLRNGQAVDMAYVLNQLFGNTQGGQQSPQRAGGSVFARNGQRNSYSGGGGMSGRGGLGSGLGLGSGSGMLASNTSRSGASLLANASGSSSLSGLSSGAALLANSMAGQVLVVADPDTNSLLVTTASRYESQVRQVITELDRSVRQVLIKVLVAEVTHDNSADFGTDFSILNTRPNGNGQGFTQAFGQPGTGLTVNFLENNLNVTLHALAQQNKLDVLSRPYILASDNQEASILVGQQVPIVTNNTTTALGQIVSSYQYQSVGIILDVTPHINPDGLVTLDVAPEISQLTSQTVSIGPGVNAPVIADRSAESRVGIRDGNTIVIGGLMQDQKTLTVNKIPIIGDIPLIGIAFSRTQVDKTKTELLIFLTPHVAQQPEELSPMSKDELKGTQLTPNAIGPGTFEDHLRGMQRGAEPSTQPGNRIAPPVMEFHQEAEPTTQPATQTIELPIH
jgi:general secretion pathway protein D